MECGEEAFSSFQKGQQRESGRFRVAHLQPEMAAVSTRPQDTPATTCWPSQATVPGLQAPVWALSTCRVPLTGS